MKYRHEVKCEITESDFYVLRQRLKAVMKPDAHTVDGKYLIRSLYFDNLDDKALKEKINGVAEREKWRIRLYNHDKSFIKLERKYKNNALGNKLSTKLSEEEAQALVCGDFKSLSEKNDPVLTAFLSKCNSDLLKPRTIVDYTREPFVFTPGNVRVTLDYNIKTGLWVTDFLNPDCPMIPIRPSPIILEVKWDEFLPDIIRDIVQLNSRRAGAFSKYASCRMFD